MPYAHIRCRFIAEPSVGLRQWIWSGDSSRNCRTMRSQTRIDNPHSTVDSPDQLFEMILQVTGMDREGITMSVMGPRANPARRFAVWALREHTLLKHKEIAEFMKMNHSQVSNVLSRFKVGDDPTLTKWAETFCDK